MNPKQILILKTIIEDFAAGVSHQLSSLGRRLGDNCLKTYPGHVALLTANFS